MTEKTYVTEGAYDGYTGSGTASGNTITMTDTDDSGVFLSDAGMVAGGYSANGNAEGNQVILTDDTSVRANVYGSFSEKGDVS